MSNALFTEQELRDLRMIFNVYDPTNSGIVEIPDLKKVEWSRFGELQTWM